ncbi:MAG TPA: hypothetical protein VFT66_23570 [Roseiflexaceae bacterium]|jgi:hypothetical protein|nr:hypothetical protein [Roseiflexaceae bacterium]
MTDQRINAGVDALAQLHSNMAGYREENSIEINSIYQQKVTSMPIKHKKAYAQQKNYIKS